MKVPPTVNNATINIDHKTETSAKVTILVDGVTKFEDLLTFTSPETLMKFITTFLDMPNPPATAITGVVISTNATLLIK